MKKPIKNDQENHQNHLNQLQNDYKDIKAQLDALNINTNKTQEDKEAEAKILIQDATSKEKQLQDEIDKINKSSKSTPKAKQEAKNAQNFLDTTNIEIKNLYDNIA
jgi:chromosome segregation ATPase